MKSRMFTVTEAKAQLSEILRDAEDSPVVIVRYSTPIAVIVSPDMLNSLYEQIEDLKDTLSVLQHDPTEVGVPWEKVKIELGLSA